MDPKERGAIQKHKVFIEKKYSSNINNKINESSYFK